MRNTGVNNRREKRKKKEINKYTKCTKRQLRRKRFLPGFAEGQKPSRNDAGGITMCVTIVDARECVSVSGASICREKDTHYPGTCIPCISWDQSANAEIWYRLINNRKTQTPALVHRAALFDFLEIRSLSLSLFLSLSLLPSSYSHFFSLPPSLFSLSFTSRSGRITALTNGMKRDALKTCRNNKFLSRVF